MLFSYENINKPLVSFNAIKCILHDWAAIDCFGGVLIMKKEKEVWKWVPGYRGFYKISNWGTVLSVGKIFVKASVSGGRRYYKLGASNDIYLVEGFNSDGYPQVCLSVNNRKETYKIHKLVALCFARRRIGCDTINHKDRDILNYHHSNLEWVTTRENHLHSRILSRGGCFTYHSSDKRYRPTFFYHINYNLGNYKSKEEACTAYIMAHIVFNIKNKYLKDINPFI